MSPKADFPVSLTGYSRDEVDDYLRDLEDDFDEALARVDALIEAERRRTDGLRKSLSELTILVQQTAEIPASVEDEDVLEILEWVHGLSRWQADIIAIKAEAMRERHKHEIDAIRLATSEKRRRLRDALNVLKGLPPDDTAVAPHNLPVETAVPLLEETAVAGHVFGTTQKKNQVSSPRPPSETYPGNGHGVDKMAFLQGKVLGIDLIEPGGFVFGYRGDPITAEMVSDAESAGLLPELIMGMTTPELLDVSKEPS